MEKNQSPQTSKIFFRTLNMFYIAMLIGQIMFLAIILFLKIAVGDISSKGLSFPFSVLVPTLTIVGFVAGNLIYRYKIKRANPKREITDKMQLYFTGTMIKLAIVEGTSLFSIVVFLITGEIYFLIFTLFLLTTFIVSSPSKQKAIIDLKLNLAETELVNNNDSIIHKVQTKK